MSKRNKDNNKHFLQNIQEKYLFAASSIFFVLLIYLFSLVRPWQPFDERVLFNESLFPIPLNFNELIEIIKTFGLNYHIESMNTFFSNHLTIRSNPLAAIFVIFFSYLFKTNVLLYHLFQLLIHLVNTALVWAIFYKVFKFITQENTLHKTHFALISVFAILWGIQSASTEAVLLVTNTATILTYTLCFLFILIEVNRFINGNLKTSKSRTLVLGIFFCLTMFFTEYGYTLPLIIFFLIFSFSYFHAKTFKTAFSNSFSFSLPYFLGILFFVIISSFRENSPLVNLFSASSNSNYNPIYIFLERNLWLIPQIFLYLMKLLLFPVTLSTYQSNHTLITNTLLNPYSIIATTIYLLLLIAPIVSLFIFKNKNVKSLLLLYYVFYFSLFPFLHILIPIYSLSADRYCYFPYFFLLLIPFSILCYFIHSNKELNFKKCLIPIVVIAVLMSGRTLIRISDWKDADSLYKASIKIEKDLLYKGQKLIVYGDYIGSLGKQEEMESALQTSISEFNKAIEKYKERKEKYLKEPITLKLYGLDLDSLILKAEYGIATVKNDNYREDPNKILEIYEPYIKDHLDTAFPNEIALYADILLRAERYDDLKEVLEKGVKLFPYSSNLLYSLAGYYFEYEKDLDKAYSILKLAEEYFPNQSLTLYKLAKYYETKNDLENLARYSYLIGLRDHSEQAYLKAATLYLSLQNLPFAKPTIKKLIALTGENPTTILLTTKYLDMEGRREKIIPLLTKAYVLSKSQGKNENLKITKNILASLIGTNIYYGNNDLARKYLQEFEKLGQLTQEDRNMIFELKQKLNT
ncbi:MAG: hypothetical protein HYR97_05590 [Candidatus Melainabacteria bacterium]|nr:hypothetical protein [Candidatus Melainabacteria bacterium]